MAGGDDAILIGIQPEMSIDRRARGESAAVGFGRTVRKARLAKSSMKSMNSGVNRISPNATWSAQRNNRRVGHSSEARVARSPRGSPLDGANQAHKRR